jgi:hypothetical protein
LSAQIADFQIKFTTESAQFNKDVEYAKKMLRGYTTEAVAANDENIGLAESLKKSADQAKLLSSGFVTVAGSVSVVMASVTAAAGYLITTQANQARELERMAVVSGETVESIQALGYASEQYGISGEKMSDILKDVNDKLGDYAQTGGGEFADFFDNILPKVGLTAEALQKMSGPDALVAVKNAMDEANVPMKDQIFYLESIANDASALMPLLENQGKKLYDLKDHYDNLNVAMSEIEIGQLKVMSQEITDIDAQLSSAFRKLGTQVTYTFLPSMSSANSKLGLLTKGVEDYNIQLRALGVTQATLNVLTGKTNKEYHDELFQEYREAKERVAAYNRVDKNNLPSINPFGQSKNDWNNAQVELALAKKKYKDYQDSVIEYKKFVNSSFDPFEDEKKKSDVPPKGTTTAAYDDSKLAAFDLQLASETEKMKLAHEQRLADIESYNISAKEIKARGFESLAELRESYGVKESEYYQSQLQELQANQNAKNQKIIDSFGSESQLIVEANEQRRLIAEAGDNALQEQENLAYEAKVTKLQEQFDAAYLAAQENEQLKTELNTQFMDAEQALHEEHQAKLTDIEKKQAAARLSAQRQQLSAYSSLFGSMSDIVGAAAGEQSGIYKAMFVASKAFAVAESIMKIQQGIANAAALPFPANIPAMATVAASTAGIVSTIQSTAMAGMAHDGIDSVPSEGTWLLNTGERVYTNDSVAKLDQMYSAVMSMYSQMYSGMASSNDATYATSAAASGYSASAIVNIFGAPEGTRVEQDRGQNGEDVTNVFLSDISSGGDMSSALELTYGLSRQGA